MGSVDQSGSPGQLTRKRPLPSLFPDYSVFYFDSEREGGYGNKDLWWVYSSNIEHLSQASIDLPP